MTTNRSVVPRLVLDATQSPKAHGMTAATSWCEEGELQDAWLAVDKGMKELFFAFLNFLNFLFFGEWIYENHTTDVDSSVFQKSIQQLPYQRQKYKYFMGWRWWWWWRCLQNHRALNILVIHSLLGLHSCCSASLLQLQDNSFSKQHRQDYDIINKIVTKLIGQFIQRSSRQNM